MARPRRLLPRRLLLRRPLLRRPSRDEARTLAEALRAETVGGAVLLVAAIAAVAWANSPWRHAYETVRGIRVGPAAWHLDLTVQAWTADGLLAVFFLVAGLELKRELAVGELRDPADAALPIAAAVFGMITPALVFLAIATRDASAVRGWAVPAATDIAFALAVLAVVGSALPSALRAFLLTLAVVDDLGAIAIIAIFYTSQLEPVPLLLAVLLFVAYALLQRARVRAWWIYVPLALLAWGLTHASGVHATVAGVALGLLTRVRRDPGERESPLERLEHRFRPLSAGLAVPLFALFSAGVAMSPEQLRGLIDDPAALGVVAGLVVGKTIGVFGGSFLMARLTRAQLSPDLAWADVLAVATLAGMGFTVALLIGELAFPGDPARVERVKAAVLVGSLTAAVLASALLRVRQAHYRELAEHEDQPDHRSER